MFLLIPSARFLETKSNRAPWVWGSLFIARIGYGLIAVLPWLVSARLDAALVWLLIAISVPATFFGAGFNPMLADMVPERDRAKVFANRSIIVSAAVALLTYLAGRWLEAAPRLGWAPFPLNYQWVYAVGFAGAVASSAYLLRIKVPASKVIGRIRARPNRETLAGPDSGHVAPKSGFCAHHFQHAGL